MPPLFCFPGQRNGTRVFHSGDGFFYHLVNERQNRRFAYLRCMHSHSASYGFCQGTAKALLNGNVLYHLQGHSHDPNVFHPLVRALKWDILARVKAGDQSPLIDIMQQEGQKYPLEVRALVAAGSIGSRFNAVRSGLRPRVPRTIAVLGAYLLLPQYEYLTKCQHVPESIFAGYCGNMADRTFSLVFISPEMRGFMQSRSMIFADGTERRLFRKPKASQIFVISSAWRFHVCLHGKNGSWFSQELPGNRLCLYHWLPGKTRYRFYRVVCMAKIIMSGRSEEAYLVLIDYLKTLMPNWRPSEIKCDFEDAQMNAWRISFPLASIEGCLWHYDVAVYRMAKNKLGLYQLVKEEEEVASIIRSAGALPLLPEEDIEDGLDDLGREAREKGWMPQLKYFFRYMAKEWIPKIPVLSVKGSLHRTNNISESANRAFNKEIKVLKPSCFDVLRAFVVTNEKATMDLHTLDLMLSPGRGRKVSALRNDARIKALTMDFENGDITRLEFLHKASRRMQNVFNKVFK